MSISAAVSEAEMSLLLCVVFKTEKGRQSLCLWCRPEQPVENGAFPVLCLISFFSGGSQQRWSMMIFETKANVAMRAEPKSLFKRVAASFLWLVIYFFSWFGLIWHCWDWLLLLLLLLVQQRHHFSLTEKHWWRDQILSCHVFYDLFVCRRGSRSREPVLSQ